MFRGFRKKHRQGYTDVEFWRKCIEGFPQERLNQLLAAEGVELCENPQRCEGLLKATFPEHSSQVSLLVNAVKIGVTKELLAAQNQSPYPVVRNRLIQRLATNLFVESVAAEWVVDAWWRALTANPNPAKPSPEVLPKANSASSVATSTDSTDSKNSQEVVGLAPDLSTATQWDVDISKVPITDLQRMLAEHQKRVVAENKSLSQRMVGEPIEPADAEISPAPARSPKSSNKWLMLLVGLGLGLLAFGIVWKFWPKPAPGPAPVENSRSNKNFSAVPNIPKLTVNYGGSTSWAPIRKVIDPQIEQAFPDFRLRYVAPVSGKPGSGTGIKMLTEGKLTLAQSSRPLKDEELQRASARGIKLQQVPVAIDAIAIVTHPELNVPGLTLEQLKQIYSGKITNWRQVGGPNLAITALSRDPAAGGTVDFFLEHVLGKGGKLDSTVKIVGDTTSGLRQTAATPGSIYYGSAAEIVGQCTVKPLPLGKTAGQWIGPYQEPFIPLAACPGQRNTVNHAAIRNGSYPLTRNLFVIFPENGQSEEQAGRAYANLLLTEQGQKLLDQAGFVSLK